MEPAIRIAILDLYDRQPNEGMRGLRSLLHLEAQKLQTLITWDVFDVRSEEDVPDDSYDIFISTGGPGNPLPQNEVWEKKYFTLIDQLWENNLKSTGKKKFVFFICHSFQLICHHWNAGEVNKRRKPAFGIFPVHKTDEDQPEILFENLSDPFFATDSREYQVIQPNHKKFSEEGFKLLALEKERPHVGLERAMMAIRFSDEFFGTQFHPEADPHGMMRYLSRPEKKQTIIKNYGEEKYNNMVDMLQEPDKILLTRQSVIPTFLRLAFSRILETADCL